MYSAGLMNRSDSRREQRDVRGVSRESRCLHCSACVHRPYLQGQSVALRHILTASGRDGMNSDDTRPRSSAGQSNGFLNRRPGVRTTSGVFGAKRNQAAGLIEKHQGARTRGPFPPKPAALYFFARPVGWSHAASAHARGMPL